MKKIIILGSTGSIGESTLAVARAHPDKLKVAGLSTKSNIELLQQQIREFAPSAVAVWEKEKADILRDEFADEIDVYSGREGLLEFIDFVEADLAVCALVGAVGLEPTLAAVKSGRDIALANKEVLVMAGEIITREVKSAGVNLIPIDSEHSALWQCLQGRDPQEVKKLIITASGGPFHHLQDQDLSKVTPAAALRHPRWQMGTKVTVDSATLMNKGFEIIEASYLFNIPLDRIEVIIQPESIVHSLVEFVDGSIIAQMHVPDMRIPIQYALSWPERWSQAYGFLNLAQLGSLHFSQPDKKRFPALDLVYQVARQGGTMPAVLNASDEVCVQQFLAGQIGFSDIVPIITKVMARHEPVSQPEIDDILQTDKWAREETSAMCEKIAEVA